MQSQQQASQVSQPSQAQTISVYNTSQTSQKEEPQKYRIKRQELNTKIPEHWSFEKLIIKKYLYSGSQLSFFQHQNGTIILLKILKSDDNFYFLVQDKFIKQKNTYFQDQQQKGKYLAHQVIVDYYDELPYAPTLQNYVNSKLYICTCYTKGNIKQISQRLDQISQKAIIAYQVIIYIKNPSLNRDYKTSIRQKLINHIKQKFWKIFKKENIKQVLKGFIDSIEYNAYLFNQSRFQQSNTHDHQITFFPTSATSQIFKFIQKLNFNEKTTFIYGPSGLGKSYAISMYHHMFQFIENYLAKNNLEAIHNFPSDIFFALKAHKIFYYSLGPKTRFQSFIQAIKTQVKILEPSKVESLFYEHLQKKEYDQLLINIKKIYTQRGIHIIYLIDQINYYFFRLRDQPQDETILQFEKIVHLLKGSQVVYSSSLNKEVLKDISIQTKFWQEFENPNKQCLLNWPLNCLSIDGLYETLNFIKFQIERLTRYNIRINWQQKIQKIADQWKKIDQLKLYDIAKRLYLPITPLKIRKFLQQDDKYLQSILNKQQPQSHLLQSKQSFVLSSLYNYMLEIKASIIQTAVSQCSKFLFKGNKLFISRKIFLLYQLLMEAKKRKKLSPQQKFLTQIFTMRYEDFIEQFTQQWKTDKKKLFNALDKNLFQFNKTNEEITVYFTPCQLIDILQKAIFSIPNRQSEYLLQAFQLIFKKNNTFLGQFLDKCFARVASQYQFSFSIDKQEYYIKNSKRKLRFFLHFLKDSKIKAKNKKQKQAKKQNPAQRYETNRKNQTEVESQQQNQEQQMKQQEIKIQKERNFNDPNQAQQFLSTHFIQLYQDQSFKKLKDNQWLGAAPQTTQEYSKPDKAISSNSPSFDFLLFKPILQNKKIIRTQLQTFDFTVGQLGQEQIQSRFQKAMYYIELIEQASQVAFHQGGHIHARHTILASNKVKAIFERLKQRNQGKYKKSRVLSLESLNVVSLENVVQFSYLSSALKYVKLHLNN